MLSVREARLQLHGGGRRVDTVVDDNQLAGVEQLATLLSVSFCDERFTEALRGLRKPLELALGQGEGDRDWRDLVDGDDASRVAGGNDIPRVDLPNADAPGHRRNDARVAQVHLRGGDRPLIHP